MIMPLFDVADVSRSLHYIPNSENNDLYIFFKSDLDPLLIIMSLRNRSIKHTYMPKRNKSLLHERSDTKEKNIPVYDGGGKETKREARQAARAKRGKTKS